MHLHPHASPRASPSTRRASVRRTALLCFLCALLLLRFPSARLAPHPPPPKLPSFPPLPRDEPVRGVFGKRNASFRAEPALPPPRFPARRPNTVLVVAAHGGVGNQLYFLLEALVLARHAHLDLVVPSLPSREFSEVRTESTLEETGAKYWHLGRMQPAVAPHGRVLPHLPSNCGTNFDFVYVVTRSKRPNTIPEAKVSSRTKQAVQFLLTGSDWGDRTTPKTQDEIAERAFEKALVQRRYVQLSSRPDDSFVDELTALRDRPVLPAAESDMSRPACVLVDGHTFARAGREGHEYLYSFMHYIEPVVRLVEMAAEWDLAQLAVMHLRYDEKECLPKLRTEGKVCIRLRLAIEQPDTVYWTSLRDLVNAVVSVMAAEGAPMLYIASSPYVPQKTIMDIRKAFGREVRLAPLVKPSLMHNDQNFVERELAVKCKCFIGDFASTWSGTVYYKRRTMGLTSNWMSVLLGKSKGLGYYEEEGPIPRPEIFEAKFAAAGV